MPNLIRIIKHEAVPGCGSFEVCFADGRVSQYFYFDDLASRRLRPEMLTREQPWSRPWRWRDRRGTLPIDCR